MSGRRPGAHDLEAAAPCRTRAAARLTWIGHATVLLELGGMRLLTDPVLRGRLSYLERQVPGVDAAGYDGIDAALVSHLHFDHLDLPSLELLGRGAPLIVPRGGGSLLRRRGFRRVTEVEVGEEVRVGPLKVRAVHAEHPGGRSPLGFPFRRRAPALGYLVAGEFTVYFAGDTGIFEGMAGIGRPRLDVALLPVSGWGPLAPLWERLHVPVPGHLDPRRAAEALRILRPLAAVPIHWGTYAPLGMARSVAASAGSPPASFRRHAAVLAPSVGVRILGPGEALALDTIGEPP